MFRRDGALAAAHARFEYRAGQMEMARAVERILASGGRLVVEAGTGTGKTLAYMVSAVQCGRRVVISTATRNLQEQIARKEIPFLRQRLGLNFTAMTMKGRENYLCLHRLEEFGREPRLKFVDEMEPFQIVSHWAGETSTGDRAEVPGLPDNVRFWREINARSDTCLGRRCPVHDDCHLVKMRRQAEQTQVLIVNHSLLFADLVVRSGDLGRVIPEYDCLIIDEAHRVEEIATQYLGHRLSSRQIADLLADCRRHGADVKEAEQAAVLLSALFQEEEEGRHRLQLCRRHQTVGPAAERLGRALSAVGHDLQKRLHGEREGEAAEKEADVLEGLRRRCEAMRTDLAVITSEDPPELVRWFQVGSGYFIFHASPIDVSEPLKSGLFQPLHAVVLTSATLSVAGSLTFLKSRLGLQEAAELRVESPFDYPEQGLLFLPEGLPEPGDADFVQAAVPLVRRLLEMSRGRAFLLFTSFARLGEMQRRLAAETDHPLLVQGDQPRAYLLERFMKTPGAVLLGTSSFWQGVDVPGDALSLVVIDRLPFAVPDDPLLSARL
ncbi:MAG: ATP-dependent DNA helicase, partial [Acidobacteriota bacterium]